MTILDDFESAWSEQAAPDLSSYVTRLVASGQRQLLSELCQIDLERRWKATACVSRWTASKYKDALGPLLDRESLCQLLRWEFYVRNCWGDFPSRLDFVAQWGDVADDLGPLLAEMSIPRPVVRCLHNGQVVSTVLLEGRLEIGRQKTAEAASFGVVPACDGARMIVAPIDNTCLSRRAISIRQSSRHAVTIENHGSNAPLATDRSESVERGSSITVLMPVKLRLSEAILISVDPPLTRQ
jgi:hypothetical protein